MCDQHIDQIQPAPFKMKAFYNEKYAAAKYAFDTTRKAMELAADLMADPIRGLEIADPEAFTNLAIKYIGMVHDIDYVEAVLTGEPRDAAESQGFEWDPGLPIMAMNHVAGLLAAAHEALTNQCVSGSFSSGLHHAHFDHGSGFCTFNGLMVAAMYAIKELQAQRILILDFDAHGGGGTWELIKRLLPDHVVQLDVTCSPFDMWEGNGESQIWCTSELDYRATIDKALAAGSALIEKPSLIIYNAGMDPINSGVSEEVISYRERAVRKFIGDTPAIFALAGGYTWGGATMEDLVAWHRMTLNAWVQK